METCPVSPPMPRLYARPRGLHLKLLCQNEFVDVLRLCALSEKEVPGQTIDHQLAFRLCSFFETNRNLKFSPEL